LVDAASMASHTSMPRSWANIASSLTRPMLTCRKVFSSSLVSSASRGELTGTVRSTMSSKNPWTAAREAASTPLTTLGVLTRPKTGLPGSMRSGL